MNSQSPISPPRWPLRLLRRVLNPNYWEELEGDMVERFHDDVQKHGLPKARRRYIWGGIKLLRPALLKKLSGDVRLNQYGMFKHNLIVTLRSFKRYRSSFLINITGLSTGLTCALLVYLWVKDEMAMDKFHEKDDRLYQVLERRMGNDGFSETDETSGPMAAFIKDAMPEVEYAAAVGPVWWPGHDRFTLSVGQRSVRGVGQYAGKDYFNIFSFDLLKGSSDQALSDKHSIVLSEGLALKLFDSVEDAMSQVIKVNQEKEFIVSGVMRDLPAQSSIQFELVMPFETLKELKPWVDSWGPSGPLVYVALKAGTKVDYFNEKFEVALKERFGDISERTAFLKKFSSIYLHGLSDQESSRLRRVQLFSTIAAFILFIACINFMNLSTARASRRLKEVGIKKVVGMKREGLITQFMGESILLSFLSLLVALLIVALFLPEYNQITGKDLSLQPTAQLFGYALGITLTTGIIAGSYPALYLSRFRPIQLLKSRLSKSTGEVWVRKGLVVFQFSISILMIVCVLVVYKQIDFVQNKDIGYSKDNVLWFGMEGRLLDDTGVFLTELRKLPGVENASATFHRMVGRNWSTTGLEWEGRDPEDRTGFQIFGVDYGFIEMMDFELIAGRPFSTDYGADDQKIIFSEGAIDAMDMEDPIGQSVDLFGEKQIIGVVKDFHFESMHREVEPSLFILMQSGSNKIMVRIEAGREKEALAEIGSFYESFNPGFSFDYQFLKDDYRDLYLVEQRVSTLARYFTGLAILISCLGLFGMVAFTAERRLKEIGIRKIMGSREIDIVRLLSNDFTQMVLISIVIALPLSYIIASKWLESFAYRIALKWWFFASAGLIALMIAWLTVSIQTLKAARTNPVDCLRNE